MIDREMRRRKNIGGREGERKWKQKRRERIGGRRRRRDRRKKNEHEEEKEKRTAFFYHSLLPYRLSPFLSSHLSYQYIDAYI